MEATEVTKRPPKITQSRFRLAEHVTLNYVITPEYGVTLEEVMDQAYWGHVAAHLKAGFTIQVMPEGLPWYARLIVVDAGPVSARVKVLEFVDLMDEPRVPRSPDMPTHMHLGDKFEIQRAGGWFRIIRSSDREVLKNGFRTMRAAEDWAAENLKVGA